MGAIRMAPEKRTGAKRNFLSVRDTHPSFECAGILVPTQRCGGHFCPHSSKITPLVSWRCWPMEGASKAYPRPSLPQDFDAGLNSFVQFYGSKHLDASLLTMPMVGFLPPHDLRVVGTIKAIETHLVESGFVGRYSQDPQSTVYRMERTSFWPVHLAGGQLYFARPLSGRDGVVSTPAEYSQRRRPAFRRI